MQPIYALLSRLRRDQQTCHTPAAIAFRWPWPGTLRGLVLWLFSLAFIVLGGINYVATDLSDTQRQALSFVLYIAPPAAWGITMTIISVVTGFSAYCHHGRDRYGYVVLAVFCCGWGFAYVGGTVLFGAGLRGISGGMIWLLFAGILTAVSGFPNVPLRIRDRVGVAAEQADQP